MRVIFLGLAFPNMSKSKYLYTELVSEFHRNGHDILAVAPAYDSNITGLQIEDGVKVLRVKTLKLFKVGFIQKGMANLMLPNQYKKALIDAKIDLNFDLIITPTPPITLYKVVSWLKKKSKGKVYLILRDIFPQNAVDLGIMKQKGLFHAYFRKKEKQLYQKSDSIGCMSEGNISYVKKHNPYIDSSKLHILPNWGGILPLDDQTTVKDLRQKEGWEDKFILVFGGNIGLPQKMENIVNLAEACTDIPNVLFLIYGNGNERENLENLLQEKNLPNIELRDGLSHNEYFKILQIADVGLISLSEKFTIPNIPSKALSYYNTKKPILASLDKNTDFGNILEKLNVGLWAQAGDTKALKKQLLELYNNPELRKQMGENGYEYMRSNLSSKDAYLTIIKHIN